MPVSRLILSIAACLIAAPMAAQTSRPAGAFVDAFVSPDWDDAADHITFVPGEIPRLQSIETVRRRSVDVTAVYRANRPISRFFTFTWLVGLGVVHRPEEVVDMTNEMVRSDSGHGGRFDAYRIVSRNK